MFSDPTFWVAISFLGFVCLVLYFKVPGLVAKTLDDRADAIRKELDEAQKLREEAQSMLAEYQRKQRDAEKEAEDIVVQAKSEADALAEETKVKLAEMLERRTKLAEDKIAQAEVQALKEVRATAADVAISAAQSLIADQLKGDKADALVEKSIADLRTKLN